MMADFDRNNRDAVLAAFLEACPIPTPAEIADWRTRFPKFSAEILELAATLLERAGKREKRSPAEPTEAELQAARQETSALLRVLERIRSVPAKRAAEAEAPAISWQAKFGSRLKSARESLGLSQSAFIKHVGPGKTLGWLRALESDDLRPDDKTLESLSAALSLSKQYLANAQDLRLVDISPRNGHKLSSQKLRSLEVKAIDFAHRYLELEALLNETNPALASVTMTTLDEAEQTAFYIRADWGLGYGPIKNLTSALEGKGVKILQLDLGKGDGLALFINEGGHAKTQIIVIGEGWPIVRRRFTLAHELAHIIAPSASEAVANRFAGAFLLPARVVQSQFPTVSSIGMTRLIELKDEFGVSLQAIVTRCRELGILNDEGQKDLFKALDKEAKNHDLAKLEGFSEEPRRFDDLVRKAHANAQVPDSV